MGQVMFYILGNSLMALSQGLTLSFPQYGFYMAGKKVCVQ